MNSSQAFISLFDNRDVGIDGNESEPEEVPSDLEMEDSDVEEEPEEEGGEEEEEEIEEISEGDSTELRDKVKSLLEVFDEKNLKVVDFLDAISWGDTACTKDAKVRNERTILLRDKKLGGILHRWARPPRRPGSNKRRALGAYPIMKDFAVDFLKNLASTELERLAKFLHSSADGSEDVRTSNLLKTGFKDLSTTMHAHAPVFWTLLESLMDRPSAREETKKEKTKITSTIVCILSYGVSAKGFDTLHALGITMSHKWTANAVERITNQCMKEVKEHIDVRPWLISHDNINIPFRVFSQRLQNQGEFGNGTAATVYVKPNEPPLSDGLNQLLRERRAEGLKNPLTVQEIWDLHVKAYPHVQKNAVYQVLRLLLESDAFNLSAYPGKDSDILKPPPALDQLPTGPENRTLQYLLGTVDIPEASYEGNSRLIEEFLQQLGVTDDQRRKEFGTKRTVPWVGDQLTMDRLRGLFKFRAEDENSYERLDFMALVFGWFHLQMAYAGSLHKQYYGTTRSRGLQQAFVLLQKKGLAKAQIKGPFHHDLNEALYHIAEAHFRVDYLEFGHVEKIEDLRQKSPEELHALAEAIVEKRASSNALEYLHAKREEQRDQQLQQVIMWNRDILQYIVLDQAIRHGDVGLVEASLPHLLFRFVGGSNPKYANEVLELLQGLHKEWPEELAHFVRHHGWLVNLTGKPGSFFPIDKAQEQNIKDIKVTYRSEGPNIKWEYLRKLHPAIHTIREVAGHIEQEFGTLTRGKKHTIPSKELDVMKLQQNYQESGYHRFEPGRKGTKDTIAADITTEGAIKFMSGHTIKQWKDRRTFSRGKAERWPEASEESDEELVPGEAVGEGEDVQKEG
ncbi:hypothetical protein CVT26_009693 [Gymnopilus dilepis]|uniref:DUF6589 domain-containing protein n=1 Tax=Gymnopilus dilepis TaxID=231916 RepID=A0A409YBN1_9AGAR|nr:hypothetical protein CVT26_009693 [Gymnopilus dilepis]